MTRRRWAGTGRSAVLVLLAVPCALLALVVLLGLVLSLVGVGIGLLGAVLPAVRGVARAHRHLAEGALARPVPLLELDRGPDAGPPWWTLGDTAALTAPSSEDLARLGLAPFRDGWRWLQDPEAWRLLGWLAFAVTGGVLLSAVTFLLLPGALAAVVLAIVLPLTVGTPAAGVLALAAGAVLLGALWWRVGDGRLRARADAALLRPGRHAVLEQRVHDLAESRSQTVDHAAAELRRIERDLHDGVQARLVALGIDLGLLADLLDSDPAAARTLLAQARRTHVAALADLRGVVRGIHPPVLADRGLVGAVEALVLDLPLRVTLVDRLPTRPSAPIESAVYFVVAELLTNVVRHASAARAWVELGATGDTLRVVVGDEGVGGADPGSGSGLRGVAARLAAFDGTMGVDSPPGGPTVITVEVPCVWSSPRTSPSSGTA
ncbi:sensor histidine kinase [Cellulomonas wangsupingiae]|uniref:histidine kinase n=1 Tax=Cellulomonas wangsupingiae TaxID=2968085 RepID=A0ABY5K6A2_9CELL|nr:histidine kinase [Cellulomonas wangsupingiae]MCC2335376.1 histidine kinase [Cellulomonas wangsupingiae]UUI64446.1 histidine kinase [Cellulomonas wangsupingiae]